MLASFIANAQSCPDNNHPHAIDLGLPSRTKWACCNVGANTPEGYGDYFAWGETEKKKNMIGPVTSTVTVQWILVTTLVRTLLERSMTLPMSNGAVPG